MVCGSVGIKSTRGADVFPMRHYESKGAFRPVSNLGYGCHVLAATWCDPFPKMNSSKIALAVLCFGLACSANAITFTLESAAASKVGGNTASQFYDVNGSSSETNGTTAKDLFSSTVGGNQNSGFWVKIAFGTNPQPVLTSAYLKASNGYLLWDAFDLAAFNGGAFDSITLWNSGASGIKNQNGKFQNTSHAGLLGQLGVRVPDGGTTAMLLGFSLVGLVVAARRKWFARV